MKQKKDFIKKICNLKDCKNKGIIKTGFGFVCSEKCRDKLIANIFKELANLSNKLPKVKFHF